LNIDKCDKCRKISTLQKYNYGSFHWMFCNTCYISATTKVGSYFRMS